MATGFTSIPMINVQPLVDGDDGNRDFAEVVKQLDHACRETGFFYARGHGVPQELLDGVRGVSHEFFKLRDADKLKIKMSSSTGYRGYQKLGENVSKGRPDAHEAIDYFREVGPEVQPLEIASVVMAPNQWPEHPEKFKTLIEEYIEKMQGLSKAILKGIALALDAPSDTFEGNRAGDPFWILRVIGYPAKSSLENTSEYGIGCGEHTDYGLLTLVNQDPGISALQVKNNVGEWIWADPIPGTLVVNIGDMLKIWSNGIYQSTIHRVINNRTEFRVSVPFFYEPNFDATVEPLEVCKRARPSGSYDSVVYGKHLIQKVLTNFT